MLTRELAIAEYDSGVIIPDWLTRGQHARYLQLAERMLQIYQAGTGQMRQQLHHHVHQLFEGELNCPTRRIDAFCKLLDEQAKYDKDKRGRAAELRQKVFRLAATKHPLIENPDRLFESSETMAKSEIAQQLGMSWLSIKRSLYSDVIQFHRLIDFEGYDSAAALLAKYNVAQTQAVLYDAVSMTVWVSQDFKLILRYAKLARLMHSIERSGAGQYVIRFDGPMSILKQTRRYGVAFAKFLPALLSCVGWKMQAVIQHPRSSWKNRFQLSPADGLNSHMSPHNLFDSSLEENFATRWGEQSRDGWTLIHEGEILYRNQKVFVPDFVFQHEGGLRVLMEVVGFWTPEYIAHKLETLSTFKDQSILLVVANSIDWPEENSLRGDNAVYDDNSSTNRDQPTSMIRYKTAIKVKDVLKALNSRLDAD